MSAPRFYVAELGRPAIGALVTLPAAAAHHAMRVLRLPGGAALTLFDGTGGEYAARLEQVDKRGAAVRIERFDPVERESSLAVTLAQAVIASDAMDYAWRKATELGACALQPLLSARSAALPAGERGERRRVHWQQVVIAACEQCGRNRIPSVAAALPLADWLAAWPGSGILLAPGAAQSLRSVRKPAGALGLLIGPEGGFSDPEVELAQQAGWQVAGLGLRVLRAETAGLAALAAIEALWGER